VPVGVLRFYQVSGIRYQEEGRRKKEEGWKDDPNGL
jgi:hypothetical protein